MKVLGLALLLAGAVLVGPQAPPARSAELSIIAPSPPGSGSDEVAQGLRYALAEEGSVPDPEIINVPGSLGLVGLNRFLSGQGDGDLLVTGLTMLEATIVTRSFGKLAQLTPIARLSQEHYGLVVPAQSSFGSIADFRSALFADPARISWAGGPVGGTDHAAAILLMQAADLHPARLNYVPLLGSADALAAVQEGRVAAALLPLGEVAAAVSSHDVRLLAVSSEARISGTDVPTFEEAGFSFAFSNWRGVLARPSLGRDRQAHFAALMARATHTDAWRALLERKRWSPAFLPMDAFESFVQREHARLKGALLAAGVLQRPSD